MAVILNTRLMASGIVAAMIVSASILSLMPYALESLQESKSLSSAKGAEVRASMDLMVKVMGENGMGMEVKVFEVEDNEDLTVTLIDQGKTDVNGTIRFSLPVGTYLVSASDQCSQGFVKVDLKANQSAQIELSPEDDWCVMTPLI